MNNVYNNDEAFPCNNSQPILNHSNNSLQKTGNSEKSENIPNEKSNSVVMEDSINKILSNSNNKKKNNNNNKNKNNNNMRDEEEEKEKKGKNVNKNTMVYIPNSVWDSEFLNNVITYDDNNLKKEVENFKQNSSNEFSTYLQQKYGKSESDLNNYPLLQQYDQDSNGFTIKKDNNNYYCNDNNEKHNSNKSNNTQLEYLSELLETLPNSMESLNLGSNKDFYASDVTIYGNGNIYIHISKKNLIL